jgi:hypothetical protein
MQNNASSTCDAASLPIYCVSFDFSLAASACLYIVHLVTSRLLTSAMKANLFKTKSGICCMKLVSKLNQKSGIGRKFEIGIDTNMSILQSFNFFQKSVSKKIYQSVTQYAIACRYRRDV